MMCGGAEEREEAEAVGEHRAVAQAKPSWPTTLAAAAKVPLLQRQGRIASFAEALVGFECRLTTKSPAPEGVVVR